jgi:chemotaxis signal transduction protein
MASIPTSGRSEADMETNKDTIEQTPYLTFVIAEEDYGVPVLAVREILEYEAVTQVPRTPAHVRGVINLRGRVVPVVDLAVRFGMPESPVTRRSCIVIVEVTVQGEPVVLGLVADSVSQVIELLPGEIEPPPSFGSRVDVAFLKGLGRTGKKFILLLDIDRIFSDEEGEEVAAAGGETKATPAGGAVSAAGVLAGALLALFLGARAVSAQEPIRDNSFLVEEAYNQPRGVVQHINTYARAAESGDWLYTFTQEWPLPDERHQLSFTLPVQDLHLAAAASTGIGDVALNYRYQALGVGGGRVAFAPRLSLLVPTGRSRDSLGAGGTGVQMNLPLSIAAHSRLVTHWNLGVTRTFDAHDPMGNVASTWAWSASQGFVWLAHPKLNLLVESTFTRGQAVVGPGQVESEDAVFVSPGVRFALDFDSGLQVVPGVAFPIGVGPSRGQRGLFVYLSLEHPFRRAAR